MNNQEIARQIKQLMDDAEENIDDMRMTSQISQLLAKTQNRDGLLLQLAEDGYELGEASNVVRD